MTDRHLHTVLIVIVLSAIGAMLCARGEYLTRSKCRSMSKPATDSTPARAVSPFTGRYEWIGDDLFCVDSNGTFYRYRK